MQTCNNPMLNNINILYVFDPILLINVFAADLHWSKSMNHTKLKSAEKLLKSVEVILFLPIRVHFTNEGLLRFPKKQTKKTF